MNKEIAARWTAALRSGEYAQTKGVLRRENGGHCCLGVLCDISGISKWVGNPIGLGYDGGMTILPASVMRWSGLRQDNGGFGDQALSELNDTGKTFAEIADVIDANVEEL